MIGETDSSLKRDVEQITYEKKDLQVKLQKQIADTESELFKEKSISTQYEHEASTLKKMIRHLEDEIADINKKKVELLDRNSHLE